MKCNLYEVGEITFHFIFYIDATSTKLKQYPRRGYIVVEQINNLPLFNLVEVAYKFDMIFPENND